MNNNDRVELINFFNAVPMVDGDVKVDPKDLNRRAVVYGYAIHPDCCVEFIDSWLNTRTANPNATFYKEWNDIIMRNRFELFVDQIIHYASTYGTDFYLGNGYVPNDGDCKAPEYTDLKILKPISGDELLKRCIKTLQSGIALKQNTMEVLCNVVIDTMKKGGKFNDRDSIRKLIDVVKNKEAVAYLSCNFGVMPTDEFGMLRCLLYQYADTTMLIKSRRVINCVTDRADTWQHDGEASIPLLQLDHDDMKRLSRIFLRFKPLFLAMKTPKTAKVVNTIRRLAQKNHTPLKTGFWETLLSEKKDIAEVQRRLKTGEIDNFRKIRLIQAANNRLISDETDQFYVIRNGKSFVRENYNPTYDAEYVAEVKNVLEESLVNSLSWKACRVKFPKDFSIAMPSSEKSFIGNYPFGTTIGLRGNSNIVGIYWRNEWNGFQHTDIDLHAMDYKGNKYGWCYDYKDSTGKLVYSGDMTNAEPEAAELFYIDGSFPDCIFTAHRFASWSGPLRFRLFTATGKFDRSGEGYMVDPNTIKFDTMAEMDKTEGIAKMLGIVHGGRLLLADFGAGYRRVAAHSTQSMAILRTLCERMKCFVSLKDILLKAGFTEVGDGERADIDFNHLEKDTLIKLIGD